MKNTLAVVVILAGAVCAWSEAQPMASVIETRAATLIAGIATLLVAFLLKKRARLAVLAIGTVFVLIAARRYILYSTVDVAFRSDVPLAGTIYRPRGVARPPILVYVHGSGPAERREFRHYAQFLARHGIASLIYDKRGSGRSGGSRYDDGYAAFARDAVAAFRAAKQHGGRVFFFAQSEADWVVPVAFANGARADGIIVASISVMTPAEQVLYETNESVRRTGHAPQRAMDLQRRVLEYQRTGRASEGLAQELQQATKEPWFDAADLPDRLWPIEEYMWWRSVMDFDVRPYWRRVDVPVLGFWGSNDTKSDRAGAMRRLDALVGNLEGHILPRAEHGMIEWCIGKGIPPPCWPERMPEILLDWIRRSSRPSAAARAGGR